MPTGRCKHFTFLVLRNKIYSMGWNDYYSTHPLGFKFGHRFCAIHSEVHCLSKHYNRGENLSKYTLINIRINRFGDLRMSKPCKICYKFIKELEVKKIIFSTGLGDDFQEMKI